jgi:hypothetical protein
MDIESSLLLFFPELNPRRVLNSAPLTKGSLPSERELKAGPEQD